MELFKKKKRDVKLICGCFALQKEIIVNKKLTLYNFYKCKCRALKPWHLEVMSDVLIPAGLLRQNDAALSSIKRSAGAESLL